MNRRAVVLAADSAATITTWTNGRRQQRFLKGENKIFQLSEHQPVGLMTFGDADLGMVPWELIAKKFRQVLGTTSFESLNGYGEKLFDYLEGALDLFPKTEREKLFKRGARDVGFSIVLDLANNPAVKAAADEPAKLTAAQNLIAQQLAKLDPDPPAAPFTESDLADSLNRYSAEVAIGLEPLFPEEKFLDKPTLLLLAELTIKSLLKRFPKFIDLLDTTGIVIAGYGDNDFFPGVIQYRCYGLLANKCVQVVEDKRSISADNTSEVLDFASTAMVRTFEVGCSPDVYSYINQVFDKTVADLLSEIENELKVPNIPNKDKLISDASAKFSREWFGRALREHYIPLTQVVGMLPIDEMAKLGETLVDLESLKEKVTRPTESIGGPIDVAAISKDDGFIWIKRKHYFDPELNPRFMARIRG